MSDVLKLAMGVEIIGWNSQKSVSLLSLNSYAFILLIAILENNDLFFKN